MKVLRNALAGLIVVLAATVIPATPASADPIPDNQPTDVGLVDPPVNPPAIEGDFGWG